ncbi:MAG: septal ring lytic transglycosylase RlpA family protein [Thermodesulfovibrionia bacterium]|nr:septal ring lytic transglycosylase RlpA family protein [Thermodesulfovibrionia bacterium]
MVYNFFIKIFLPLFVLLYFSSCASSPPAVVQPPASDYVVASWYGKKFHGRLTASGERYNMYDFTCAHKQFPFGTRLRVTNVRNNRSVIVKVNDRGPFIRGRDIDLSYAAARQIGLVKAGVGRVRIQHLGRDVRYVKRITYTPRAATGPLTIQLGSFKDEHNARRLMQGLKMNYQDVYINTTVLYGQKYYRVRIGTFSNRESANSFAQTLAQEGYSIFITKKYEK